MKTWKWLGVLIPVVALLGCGGGGDSVPVRVQTLSGPVVGVHDDTSHTVRYLGIPFAKAPVGDLRWKAPVAPDAWTTPLAADTFGQACLQHGRIYGPGSNNTYDDTVATTLNQPVGAEDCLTLNIWRPDSNASNLPVIVFFYGGSNISGYSADPIYDGANLARKANAVVVSANYRVGLMGWLRLAQLQEGTSELDDSGNFGTLDTVAALQFVQDNIARFGGDKDNVTIWGHSAGAVNVFALMASPQAAGLFHKAVPMSGGATSVKSAQAALPSMQSTAVHEGYAMRLLHALVIDHSGDAAVTDAASAAAYVAGKTKEEIATFLRGLTGAQIITSAMTPRAPAVGLTANGAAVATPASPPIPEGKVIPVDVIQAFKDNDFNNVPVMVGNTRDEGKLFGTLPPVVFGGASFNSLYAMNDHDRFMAMKNFDPDTPTDDLTPHIRAEFLPITTAPGTVSFAGDYNDWTQIYGRAIFTDVVSPRTKGVAAEALDALKSVQPQTYYFQFDWDREPAPWNVVYGAAHGFELPFFFANFDKASLFSNTAGGTANEQGRLALSDAMLNSLAAFARTGNPNHTGLGVTWGAWPQVIRFDASDTTTEITME